MPLLIEARPVIARYFGGTRVHLQVIYDPEGDQDEAELFAFIETSLGFEAAGPLLDRYRDDWWIGASRRADCLLEFSLRYV